MPWQNAFNLWGPIKNQKGINLLSVRERQVPTTDNSSQSNPWGYCWVPEIVWKKEESLWESIGIAGGDREVKREVTSAAKWGEVVGIPID